MDEKKIQHEYVMEFLCRLEEQGGLGYRSVSNQNYYTRYREPTAKRHLCSYGWARGW